MRAGEKERLIFLLQGTIFVLACICAVAFRDYAAKCYFAMLAIAQPCLAFSYRTEEYAIFYYGVTGILLFLGMWVALDVLESSRTKGLVSLAAILFAGGLFYAASKEAHTFDDMATVVEETLLAGYCVLVGLSAPCSKQPVLYVSLALAWLFQAGFGFGYMLHIGNRNWYLGNQFVPAFINIALYGWAVFYAITSRRRPHERLGSNRAGNLLF